MDAAKPAQGTAPRPVDEQALRAKWQQAYALLQEANRLDPTNTEVLLHIAQLLTQLTPDDPGDEQKILYRIQKLLGNPRTDVERFQLARLVVIVVLPQPPFEFMTMILCMIVVFPVVIIPIGHSFVRRVGSCRETVLPNQC